MPDSTQESWNVLVVDDDEDVHAVTGLALKRQQWLGRAFSITRADSAKQAKQILAESAPARFHVALVDVVMETDSAGLDLCDYIRAKLPMSLRIILRTGQPGVAPEERVIEDFEIDHYLAKVDATADRIKALVIASLRSSMDVRMLLALREQLESFVATMQGTRSAAHLDETLARGLSAVGWKYRAHTFFYSDLDASAAPLITPDGGVVPVEEPADAERRESLLAAHKAAAPARTLHRASRFGLGAEGALLWIDSLGGASASADGGLWGKMKRILGGALPDGPRPFGVVIEPARDLGPKRVEHLERDITPFADNWAMAQRILSLQEGVGRMRTGESPVKAVP